MTKFLKTVLIAITVVLVPLRTMAAVNIDFSPGAHRLLTIAQAPAEAEPGGASSCAHSVSHCPSGALSDAPRVATTTGVATSRVPHAERAAQAFVPETLDRPPLTPLR